MMGTANGTAGKFAPGRCRDRKRSNVVDRVDDVVKNAAVHADKIVVDQHEGRLAHGVLAGAPDPLLA
jgi:hypothetical protein